jgi:hypothetical protein
LTDVSEVLTASIFIALMMEAVSTSETSVSFYEPTQRKSHKTVVFILAAVRTRNLAELNLTYTKFGFLGEI